MVFNVGICGCQAFIYDDVTKTESIINILPAFNDNDYSILVKMFNELKQKLNGDLGFACICVDEKNEHRKLAIDAGLAVGFIEVSIMSKFEAYFHDTILKFKNTEFNEGDIIFLINVWECYAWEKINGKPRMIDFSRIYYSREHPHSEGHLEMRRADFQDFSRLYQPKILFYNFLKLNYSYQNAESIPTKFEHKKSILAKARMMAGDSEIIDLNIQTTSFAEIKIEFEEKFILMIPRCTPLPYTKTIKIERKTTTLNQFFEVLEDDVDPAKSKKYEKFILTEENDLVTIKIDENNVYAIEQNQSSE